MALFSTLGGAFFGPIGAAIGGVVDGKMAKKRRGGETSTQESRINFQQMADDASAAGFNPLTALRTTGGMGNVVTKYTSPLIDNGKFGLGDAAQSAYSGYSNFMGQHKQAMQFGLETDLMKSQIALNKSQSMPKLVEDIYAKFNDTDNKVPLNFLGTDFVMPRSMAEFMQIKPNSSISAGTMTEILGEGQEVYNFFSSKGQLRTFGITSDGRRSSDDYRKDTFSLPKIRPWGKSNPPILTPSGINAVTSYSNEISPIKVLPTINYDPSFYGGSRYGLPKSDPISNTLNSLMKHAF